MTDAREVAMRLTKERKAIKRRLSKAREGLFPRKTCPASRHVHLIVDGLLDRRSSMRRDLERMGYEPEHMGESIASVLEGLWRARRFLRWQPKVDGDPLSGGSWVLDPAAVRAELEKING